MDECISVPNLYSVITGDKLFKERFAGLYFNMKRLAGMITIYGI
jgi:hypothetical protein